MPIHLDLYSGAYGLTLRIDVQVRKELERLVHLFGALASGEALEVDLLAEASSEPGQLVSVRLLCRENEGAKHLQIDRQGASGAGILWTGPRDHWDDIEHLARALLAQDSPRHQYLTREGVDDALVELAYLERPGR